MTTPRISLTLKRQSEICGFILSGSYPHVAAEAAGVPREVFDDWLKRGRSRKAAKRYRAFRKAILQAEAQARLTAEVRTLNKDPLNWLKCGPGRDRPDAPGWGNPVRVTPSNDGGHWLMNREFQDLVTLLMRVLQPYPEIRLAVVKELDKQEAEKNEEPPTPEES